MKLSELKEKIKAGDKISFYRPRHVIVKEVTNDHVIVYDPALHITFPLSFLLMDDTHNFEFVEPAGLDKPIEDLELSGRAMNGLRRITWLQTIRDLTRLSRTMLECVPGIGEKSVKEIEYILQSRSASLKKHLPGDLCEFLSRIKH